MAKTKDDLLKLALWDIIRGTYEVEGLDGRKLYRASFLMSEGVYIKYLALYDELNASGEFDHERKKRD